MLERTLSTKADLLLGTGDFPAGLQENSPIVSIKKTEGMEKVVCFICSVCHASVRTTLREILILCLKVEGEVVLPFESRFIGRFGAGKAGLKLWSTA